MTVIHTFEQDPALLDLDFVDIIPVMHGQIGQRENYTIQVGLFGYVMARYLMTYEYNENASLINSWVYYGGGFIVPCYYRDAFEVVHLRGMVKDGISGQPAFVLAAGFRPVLPIYCLAADAGGAGRVKIESSGEVILTPVSNEWVSLEGISFRIPYTDNPPK
jgi:hypothetical protein